MSDIDDIILEETLQILRDNGYGDIVDAMLDHTCYTGGGRLNMSSLSRKLGCSTTSAATRLAEIKRLLDEK